jgi:hypothetical protein
MKIQGVSEEKELKIKQLIKQRNQKEILEDEGYDYT